MAISDFRGKVAAITGAGSGMGRALAQALAARGCHVSIADVNEQGLQGTADSINQDVRVTTHVVDVADREQVDAFANQTAADHGQVNMIFNNAGVSVTDSAERMTLENFEWLMNINFWGVIYGTRAFLPHLQAAEEGAIVNTSSIFGTIAVPSQSAYNASKFAVRGYTYSLRQELIDTHIGVSCVQPGGVKTNIVRDSRYVARDNEAPTREDFVKQFDEMAGLTSDQAAEQILRGVLRNKAQILVGRDARFAALVERIAPTGYLKLMERFIQSDDK